MTHERRGAVHVAFQIIRDTDDDRPHVEIIEAILTEALEHHGYTVQDRPPLAVVPDDVSTDTTTEGA